MLADGSCRADEHYFSPIQVGIFLKYLSITSLIFLLGYFAAAVGLVTYDATRMMLSLMCVSFF